MWPQVPKAMAGLEWGGRIVIDPTNAFDPAGLDGRTSSEVVADLVAPARVVKAGTFAAAVLGAEPDESGGQRAIFLSGDDATAKTEVGALFAAAGFAAIDLGDLRAGGRIQQVGGPLAGKDLVLMP